LQTSALALIRQNKDRPRLRIGILYNAEPFASLSDTGDVIGFEADIGRAIAEDWGIPTGAGNPSLFRQVTRQNGVDLLERGEIDLLMGQMVITRDREKFLDFSHPYFMNSQVALALSSQPKRTLTDLGGSTIGVVLGTPSEAAVSQWAVQSGAQVTIKRVLMFDDGIRALVSGEIAVLVGDRWELDARVRGAGLSGLKLLEGVFQQEPYAIAIRNYDYALRMLVNRTLQRLAKSNRLDQLYAQWFPESILPKDRRVIPTVWNNLDDDKRSILDFPVEIAAPGAPVIARMNGSKVLRVGGLGQPNVTGSLAPIDAYGQAVVNDLARRWGVTAQFVPGDAVDLLASGGADLAIGLEPRWGNNDLPDRVDYTAPYAMHGYRLLVVTQRNISGFGDLQIGLGKNIGIFADDEGSFAEAERVAKTAGVINLQKILIRDENEIPALVSQPLINSVFGDSLRLVPLAKKYSNFMTLLPQEYTREPISFAVPRGDSEFRVLVEITLQDMAREGIYQQLWNSQFGIGEPLPVIQYP
jgi:ABC-type amino acid transport substrate-binding protein